MKFDLNKSRGVKCKPFNVRQFKAIHIHVHVRTISGVSNIVHTRLPPDLFHSNIGLSHPHRDYIPGVPVFGVLPIPGVPVLGVPPIPGVPVFGVLPIPGVPVLGVPPMPGVPVFGVGIVSTLSIYLARFIATFLLRRSQLWVLDVGLVMRIQKSHCQIVASFISQPACKRGLRVPPRSQAEDDYIEASVRVVANVVVTEEETIGSLSHLFGNRWANLRWHMRSKEIILKMPPLTTGHRLHDQILLAFALRCKTSLRKSLHEASQYSPSRTGVNARWLTLESGIS